MRPVIVEAPTRLDLAGGTLDIWPVCLMLPEPAVTVNVALDVPCRIEVTPLDAPSEALHLDSADQGATSHHASLPDLVRDLREGRCTLPLLACAVAHVGLEGGCRIHTEASSPAGAGLGGSSSLLVALLAALLEAGERRAELSDLALCRVAQDLEAGLLRGPTGYQDHVPPLFGGCLALEARPGGFDVETLPVDLDALARRLRLVYTGAPHVSAITNWSVLRAFLDGEAGTVAALEEVARLSRSTREHLRGGRLDAALVDVVAEGRCRRALAPGVATPAIDALDEAARAAGALGTKILGAGGGGSVLVVLPDGDSTAVDAALAAQGHRILPVRLPSGGLRVSLP